MFSSDHVIVDQYDNICVFVVAVGSYFEKRRALANGLSLSGAAIGSITGELKMEIHGNFSFTAVVAEPDRSID
jgi:hypothetical protein